MGNLAKHSDISQKFINNFKYFLTIQMIIKLTLNAIKTEYGFLQIFAVRLK